MSRVAKSPVKLPKGIEATLTGQLLKIKGSGGQLEIELHALVTVEIEAGVLRVVPKENSTAAWAHAGTARSLANKSIVGVSQGFERKLQLVGVGYRAQVKGNTLSLTLGYSHPIDFELPAGVKAETPSQTEIVLKSMDNQLLGQVAANVRRFRPPEPYKGKGVRYSDEQVYRKEAKKK